MSLLFLALAAALTQGAEANDTYFIGDVSSSVASDAVLGSVGSGLACVPVGKLRWADVTKATPVAWVDAGQRALVAGQLAPAAGAGSGRYRVTLAIKALKLDLCLAWMGIGKKPRGKGVATVTVAVRDTVANVDLPSRDIDVDLNLKGRDPRKDDSVLTQVVGDAVRAFIASRTAN